MSEDLVPLFVNVPREIKERLKLYKSRTKEDFTTQVVNALREYHEEEDSTKKKLDLIMQKLSVGVPTTTKDTGASQKELDKFKGMAGYSEQLRKILSHLWDLEIENINEYSKSASEGQTSGMKMLQTVCMKVGISRQEAIELFKWVLGLAES